MPCSLPSSDRNEYGAYALSRTTRTVCGFSAEASLATPSEASVSAKTSRRSVAVLSYVKIKDGVRVPPRSDDEYDFALCARVEVIIKEPMLARGYGQRAVRKYLTLRVSCARRGPSAREAILRAMAGHGPNRHVRNLD